MVSPDQTEAFTTHVRESDSCESQRESARVIDLRCGDWRDVLADVECDALICDPPYSERTHSGHDAGTRDDGHHDATYGHRAVTKQLGYAPWTEQQSRDFVAHWAPRTRGWMAILCDHHQAPIYAAAMEAAGRYAFSPVPIVEIGSRVRLSGDGPSSWTCWLAVSRPSTREFQRWGTLRGAYVYTGRGDREHMGGKRTDTMRDIVRDYSRPGDLVCDPCGGMFTTALAALTEGRRAVSCEMDPETFAKAQKRIARGYTPPLFVESRPEPTQEPLL